MRTNDFEPWFRSRTINSSQSCLVFTQPKYCASRPQARKPALQREGPDHFIAETHRLWIRQGSVEPRPGDAMLHALLCGARGVEREPTVRHELRHLVHGRHYVRAALWISALLLRPRTRHFARNESQNSRWYDIQHVL